MINSLNIKKIGHWLEAEKNAREFTILIGQQVEKLLVCKFNLTEWV